MNGEPSRLEPRGTDWYSQAVEEVEAAAQRLTEAVAAAVGMLTSASGEFRGGVALPDIVARLVSEGGRDTRRSSASAYAAFEAAVSSYRARVVKALIEDNAMTYTEIGRLIGVSRQMVARLHRLDLDVTGGCDRSLS